MRETQLKQKLILDCSNADSFLKSFCQGVKYKFRYFLSVRFHYVLTDTRQFGLLYGKSRELHRVCNIRMQLLVLVISSSSSLFFVFRKTKQNKTNNQTDVKDNNIIRSNNLSKVYGFGSQRTFKNLQKTLKASKREILLLCV